MLRKSGYNDCHKAGLSLSGEWHMIVHETGAKVRIQKSTSHANNSIVK